MNGLAPGYISDLIDYYNPDTNVLLRSVEDKKLDVPFSRSELFIKAFSISGPNTFNLLPKHVRESKSLSAFKASSFNHFYQCYIDSII